MHEGEIERACRSPTLLREDKANNRTVFSLDFFFSVTVSKGSNRCLDSPCNTMDRSHDGTRAGRIGRSRREPWINRETRGWWPTETLSMYAWLVDMATTYTLRVTEVTPSEKRLWRNSSTEATGVSTKRLHSPSANAKDALCELYSAISEQQTDNPDGFFIIAGDFNHANLKTVLSKFYQHVNFATRGPHLCYANPSIQTTSQTCQTGSKADHGMVR